MNLAWPKTVRGWLELFCVVGAILAAIAGGAWKLHTSNAYASDIAELDILVAEGLKAVVEENRSERCATWLSEITLLEDRQASGTLTEGQRTRLIWLLRQYADKCSGRD